MNYNKYNNRDGPLYEGVKGGARGYTGFSKEQAKNRTVGDLKEFFHIGLELPVGHPMSLIINLRWEMDTGYFDAILRASLQ